MNKMTKNQNFPGELNDQQLIERIIRVDHAGEYGAARIYDGQLDVLKNTPAEPIIRKMALQEQRHLDYFDKLHKS